MENIVSITELREKTVKVLNEAAEKQQLLYIVVRSKPKVVIEPIELYKAREEELVRLKKKVFEYETLKALIEAKEGKGEIFKSAKVLLASVEKK
jgi:prevent-host-death family protein